MNNRSKILMVFVFSVLLISANFSLYSGEKEMEKCPSCGQKMEQGKGVSFDHHGKTVHVCSEQCKTAFEKKVKDSASLVTYKCPMDSCNYTSDEDGKCPKCGMALEKVVKKSVYKCTTKGCSYTSDKEGKCPMCKTDLKKVESSYHKDHKKHMNKKNK